MHPDPVAAGLDVLEDILPRLLPCFMASFLGKLPLERLEERFRRCVARRRSRLGCRLRHAMGVRATPEGLGCVSDALAAMEDEASIIRGIPSSCSLLDSIDGDLPGDPVRHRPADRLAREGVYRGRQAKPALSGRHAGYASNPEPAPLVHGEDAFDEVQARVARLRPLCDPMPPGRPFGDDPWLPHDMQHALPARDDAAAAQFLVDAPAAAAALMPAERIDDEPFERLALDPGIRLLPSEILIEVDWAR